MYELKIYFFVLNIANYIVYVLISRKYHFDSFKIRRGFSNFLFNLLVELEQLPLQL